MAVRPVALVSTMRENVTYCQFWCQGNMFKKYLWPYCSKYDLTTKNWTNTLKLQIIGNMMPALSLHHFWYRIVSPQFTVYYYHLPFSLLLGPAATSTVSCVTLLCTNSIIFNGYQTQAIYSWGLICQSLSEYGITCSHQKDAELTPANVVTILLPLWSKLQVYQCCPGSAEVIQVSLQDHPNSLWQLCKPKIAD
jgi:hypothetical protein